MRNKSLRQVCMAIIMLVGIAVCPVRGQQPSGAAAKPAQNPASTPDNQPKAEAPGAVMSPEEVVLKVGDAKVTKADIDYLIGNLPAQNRQVLALQGRKPLGDEYAKMLVLSQQALNDHLESNPSVRQNLELQRRRILAGAELEKLSKEIQVSPDEVTQYYTAHQPDFERVQMREFSIRKRPANSTDAKLGLTAEEAKAKADAIREAVTDGTDIKKIAEQYKDPNAPNVVTIETEPRPVPRHVLLPALEAAAFSLKDGEVSQPIELGQLVYLIQVTGHTHAEQKEVTAEIETKLKQQKFEAKLADLKKQVGVWMDGQYFTGPPTRPPVPAAVTPSTPPPAPGQAPKQ